MKCACVYKPEGRLGTQSRKRLDINKIKNCKAVSDELYMK